METWASDPREPSSDQQQGTVCIWDLRLAASSLAMVLSYSISPAPPSPPRHPHWVWLPLTLVASHHPPLSVCVRGQGVGWGRPLFGQGSWDGGGALGFLLFIALGLWGGFPWPPPPPREGEGARVSHRPGAGAQG